MTTPHISLPKKARLRSLPNLVTAVALFAVGAFAIGTSHAVLIEFSSEEGYANGTLNGQPSGSPVWAVSVDTGTPFQVNAAGGGSVAFNTTLGTRIAGYNSAIDFTTGAAFTTSIEFTFVQSTATVTANTVSAGLIYADTASTGSINTTAASIGRLANTADGYRLAFANGSVNIAGTALGINSGTGDTTSDVIRLTYTLQQGASPSTWIGTETIFNVTTGTVVATRTSSAINIGANDPTSFFNAMQLGGTMPTSGISSFEVLSYSAVPEPAISSLVAFCAFAMTMSRRRRIS